MISPDTLTQVSTEDLYALHERLFKLQVTIERTQVPNLKAYEDEVKTDAGYVLDELRGRGADTDEHVQYLRDWMSDSREE